MNMNILCGVFFTATKVFCGSNANHTGTSVGIGFGGELGFKDNINWIVTKGKESLQNIRTEHVLAGGNVTVHTDHAEQGMRVEVNEVYENTGTSSANNILYATYPVQTEGGKKDDKVNSTAETSQIPIKNEKYYQFSHNDKCEGSSTKNCKDKKIPILQLNFGLLEFDFNEGIMSALSKVKGNISEYENVIETIFWEKSKFRLDENEAYFDFDMFFECHKKIFLPENIIDSRIKSIQAESPPATEDEKSCNELEELISLLTKESSDISVNDLNELFISGNSKDKAEFFPVCLSDFFIQSFYNAKCKQFAPIDFNLDEISRSYELFEDYIKKKKIKNNSFTVQRDFFISCVTNIFFKYNSDLEIYVPNSILLNIQIFMPEFYLYIIWKFKHLYNINEDCEESINIGFTLKKEMVHLKNIVAVLDRMGDDTHDKIKQMNIKIKKYRVYILENLGKYHTGTLSHVLYMHSCSGTINYDEIHVDNINIKLQLLAFIDKLEMLDAEKIKDDIKKIEHESYQKILAINNMWTEELDAEIINTNDNLTDSSKLSHNTDINGILKENKNKIKRFFKKLIEDNCKTRSEIFARLQTLTLFFELLEYNNDKIKISIQIIIQLNNMVLIIFRFGLDNKICVVALNGRQALRFVMEHINNVMGRNIIDRINN